LEGFRGTTTCTCAKKDNKRLRHSNRQELLTLRRRSISSVSPSKVTSVVISSSEVTILTRTCRTQWCVSRRLSRCCQLHPRLPCRPLATTQAAYQQVYPPVGGAAVIQTPGGVCFLPPPKPEPPHLFCVSVFRVFPVSLLLFLHCLGPVVFQQDTTPCPAAARTCSTRSARLM
jgi:hypothetical protein